MAIDDSWVPEGFEIARFAKPQTKEAELAPDERRLIVEVIIRSKPPRRWVLQECDGKAPGAFMAPLYKGTLIDELVPMRVLHQILPPKAST